MNDAFRITFGEPMTKNFTKTSQFCRSQHTQASQWPDQIIATSPEEELIDSYENHPHYDHPCISRNAPVTRPRPTARTPRTWWPTIAFAIFVR
jgi:hypothetical protein